MPNPVTSTCNHVSTTIKARCPCELTRIPSLRDGKSLGSAARIAAVGNVVEDLWIRVLAPKSANLRIANTQHLEAGPTKVGFTNPTVVFPTASRSSLIRFKTEAKTGDAADVPPMSVGAPILKMTTLSPIAETSG